MPLRRILLVRLGAMGDIIHTLPAAATLKQSFSRSEITWVVEPKWAPLLEGNPFIDRVLTVDRRSLASVRALIHEVRSHDYEFAVDFQGLIKSAIVTFFAGAERIYGFDRSQVRERLAALFYSNALAASSMHVVDRNLELARFTGATNVVRTFRIPEGREEGSLPSGPFVLANPIAGWASKQWPLERYGELAAELNTLGLQLVVNGPRDLPVPGAWVHVSGLPGLIHATRKALAVVGIDSGPMHLASALGKPGVAIFGPTDPARHGPYGDSMKVLRSASAATSYKRMPEIQESMREISADQVLSALKASLAACATPS